MNTGSPSQVRAALAELGVRPNPNLGQNFLVDKNVAGISVTRADIGPGDCVLEIGPGLGILTEALLAAGARVVAVELDRRLHAFLETRLTPNRQLDLRLGDGLKLDFDVVFGPGAEGGIRKVVANLPYVSGTRMLVAMIQSACRPDCIVITVQKEVAQRICAARGTSAYGLLSVWAQQAYTTQIEHLVSPRCFWPAPDVDSAIVGMALRADNGLCAGTAPTFYALSKFAFSQRRKQIGALLSRYAGRSGEGPGDWVEQACVRLVALGHSEKSRPEELSPADWVCLAGIVAGAGGAPV